MKLETKIKSVEAEIQKNKLILRSKTPLKILSSAVLNGGLREANCIVSVQVPEETGLDIECEPASLFILYAQFIHPSSRAYTRQ